MRFDKTFLILVLVSLLPACIAQQEAARSNVYESSAQMALIIILALAPIVGLLLAQKRLGALNAAAWLVTYGSTIIAGEHTYIGLVILRQFYNLPGLHPHARYHFFMAGVYTFVAAVLLIVVGWTLLRTGTRSGWYAICFALVLGGTFELLAATFIFPHGFPPASIPLGLYVYAYIPAFGAALAISFRPVFRKQAA
jgi:hypothetical protein